MSQTWCVVAYYYTGGVEIYGPYDTHEKAVRVSAEAEASVLFETAVRISMNQWEGVES